MSIFERGSTFSHFSNVILALELPLELWLVIWLLGAQKCAHNPLPPPNTAEHGAWNKPLQRIPLNNCANTAATILPLLCLQQTGYCNFTTCYKVITISRTLIRSATRENSISRGKPKLGCTCFWTQNYVKSKSKNMTCSICNKSKFSEAKRRASRMEESPPGLLRLVPHIFTKSSRRRVEFVSFFLLIKM